MSNENSQQPEVEAKQLSQADRAKQLLAARKQQQGGPGKLDLSTGTKKLTSQNTKKVNNQRKKMGV
ncbi:MAG TPA: hypothetical protein IAA29_02290 [Candidatus Paenibacillus intestinavium]|nr:hypothetical protein [Candidatus Paenibacillus intestinavium]